MTEKQVDSGRLLWFENLNFPLAPQDARKLEEQVGIQVLALDDPDEWVLGYRIVGTAVLETATILYLTRRFHDAGVRFDMKSMAAEPPETDELHELVKQYIRDFSPTEASEQQTEAVMRTERWRGARSVVVDYRATEASLHSRELALARAYVAERMHFEIPALASVGLSGYADVDLMFPPAGGSVAVTISLGISGPFDRVRVHAAIGDKTFTARFSSVGIATVEGMPADSNTDLLHLAFELKS